MWPVVPGVSPRGTPAVAPSTCRFASQIVEMSDPPGRSFWIPQLASWVWDSDSSVDVAVIPDRDAGIPASF